MVLWLPERAQLLLAVCLGGSARPTSSHTVPSAASNVCINDAPTI